MTTTEVSDEDFQEILAQTRHFVRTAVVPREQEILADDRVPDDLREQVKKMGLFGYAIPQEWGGLGLNLAQDVELAMELGYTSLALRSMFGTNNGIAGQVLVGFGTDEQKSRWLEPIATGDVVASFALTEPGAGSNPSGLRTKAVRDGSVTTQTGSSTARSVSSPTRRSPTCSSSSRARARPTTTARASRYSWCPPTPPVSRSAPRTPRWARKAPGPPTSASTDVRVPAAALDRRQRGHRIPGGDDLAGAWPRPHRRAVPSAPRSVRSTSPSPTRPRPPKAAHRSAISSLCRR